MKHFADYITSMLHDQNMNLAFCLGCRNHINEIMYIGGHQMSSCKGKTEGSILKILTQYKQFLIEFSL